MCPINYTGIHASSNIIQLTAWQPIILLWCFTFVCARATKKITTENEMKGKISFYCAYLFQNMSCLVRNLSVIQVNMK